MTMAMISMNHLIDWMKECMDGWMSEVSRWSKKRAEWICKECMGLERKSE